jgi:hypothetical protein
MTEARFDAEAVLQALIAQHPEMLADEVAGQSPLLLVRREAAIRDEADAGGRFSLDHLYIDANGVPTLVEVKRSSDTRARREVVAQMLDYAANAKVSFSVEKIAAWVEDNAQQQSSSTPEVLSETLGIEDPDAFWATVATNLDAERFRLIFVSDAIPPELRRIIEFLNGQMSSTEVLAIEVKQYVDDTEQHQTIVPRIIGNTETAKQTKHARRAATRIDRASLLATLAKADQGAAQAAQALLDWEESRPDLSVRWNQAGDIGFGVGQALVRLFPEATVEVKVNTLRKLDPAWDDDRIEQLVQRLEQIEGVRFFKGSRRQWPRTQLAPLADPGTRDAFLAIINDVVESLRRG